MNEEKNKRPIGLTIIAILWLISGIIHIYLASEIVRGDLEALEYLSLSWIPEWEWFSFVVPTELTLSIIVLCLAVLQILTVPGLLAGKKYSHRLALATPVAFVIVNLALLGLYLSAPSGIDLGNSLIYPAVSVAVNVLWVLVYWKYLAKPDLKTYLGVTQPKPPVPDETEFYCRHCGAENKIDAEFCEKCGKNIE